MAPDGEDTVQDLGTSSLRHSTPPPSGLRQRHLTRAAALGEPARPLNQRRSSIFSESLSDARRSIKSSTEDLFVPRISTSERQDTDESSAWHSLPLGLALLPAVGGLFFKDGSAILTDLTLLGISAVFMNWALRVPWDWYRGSQTLTFEQIDTTPIFTLTEDDESQLSETARVKAKEKLKPAKSSQAQFELRVYELAALASCFIAPALATWLLHAIRSQLSRPSEGLVSNYNLTIFLLVSEIRPFSHLIKLMQRRMLFLQRTVNADCLQAGTQAKDLVLSDLSTRVDELEKHLAERIDSTGDKSNDSPDSIISKASTQALSDIKGNIQPELDALGRAMRRYEKRATISAVQFDARLKELEASLKDVVVLAAAAQRNVEQQPTNYVYVLANWACAMVVVPIQALLAMLILPQKVTSAVLCQLWQLLPGLPKSKKSKETKIVRRPSRLSSQDRNNWEALAEAAKSNGGQPPYSISLVTSEFPNDKIWSEENLPTILFYLTPPTSAYDGQAIHTFLRDDGKRLRSFEVLPDRISIDIKGWLIEAWRRLDPRISYEDIIDRMTADPEYCEGKGLSIPTKNSLQMHTLRSCRKLLGYWQLEGQKDEPSRAMVEAIERLTPSNLLFNTVLPLCPQYPNRLVRLKFERKTEDGQFKAVPVVVTPDNIEMTTLPLTFFCDHLHGNSIGIGVTVDRAWETLLILQERAEIHGLSHWSKLHKNCRPISWQTRTRGAIPDNRPDDDKDGDDRIKAQADTYDGGCSVCTWRPKLLATYQEEVAHSLKRARVEEGEEQPVASRLRSETYGYGLSSETNGMVHSSPPTYLPPVRQDYGHVYYRPSTPLGYGTPNPMQTFNSSPPSYYYAVEPASQSTMSSRYAAQGMSGGSSLTPLSSQSGLPRSYPGIRSPSELMQPLEVRGQTSYRQCDIAHDDAHQMLPSMSHMFPDWTTQTHPTAAVGLGQAAPAQPRSWQRLPEVQRRTMDLQHALSSPGGRNAPRYGHSQALDGYRHSAYDISNGPPQSVAPTPTLYASKNYSRDGASSHVKHRQHHDPMFTSPATPQFPYEPSLSGSAEASFTDSPLEAMPNLEWDDDVFRFMLHSDEANGAPEDDVNAMASLPDGAAIKELGSPWSMHAAKHERRH
ncbi:hypothetical protein DV738_g3774, partial [Chaetothyriales sp. CBS 135597]